MSDDFEEFEEFKNDLKQLVVGDVNLPKNLFVLPLQGRPIFPGIFTPIFISEGPDSQTVEKAMERDSYIAMVATKKTSEAVNADDLYTFGTVAKIMKKNKLPDGGYSIFVSTIKRFKIKKYISKAQPISATVEFIEDKNAGSRKVKALMRILVNEMKEVADNNPLFTEDMRINMLQADNPGKIADFVSSVLNLKKDELEKILETADVEVRLEKLLVHVRKELELVRLQKKVVNELNENIARNQREHFLRAEMKAIQDELGSDLEGNLTEYQKFKNKIDEFHFEGEIKETVEGELEKLKLMDPNSSEYMVTRNYLNTITLLPWNVPESQSKSIKEAEEILEADHFGLEDVKKRILEFLAVRDFQKEKKGSIILLVGPPGVGKTSVGRSIASAMNKEFYRFSVGGMRDEAEIKGHRRTYVGALPGRIIQGLKLTHAIDPVFMIDEIDKMGESRQGDPASALLEVLDPEQNITFRDEYLDLPFDISKVVFILTANSTDTIPGPLLDRAEVIRLSGYVDQEKLEIAKKYLIPKNAKKNGVPKGKVSFTTKALSEIAKEYAREAGVRNFEKCIDKIHRKILKEILDNPEELKDVKFKVDVPDLEKYLGKPVFDESQQKKADVPGTTIGLAWTSMGGDTLLIESMFFPGKGSLILTGQMGDVMKESCQIALNWAKKYVLDKKVKNQKWFEQNDIHLHIPEGAVPKDGPSAGITIATNFVSLFTNKKIKPHLAMTGELSLTGKVLPIGGLREKSVAAKRNGIKVILIPKANEKDLEEIPELVKKGLTFIPVSHIQEVLDNAF
ncbi:MAG: endopeptidase La [Treponema sp.]|nr:endopeptidase La [Treponema sp.]